MPVQTSVIEPAIAVAGMVYDASTDAEGVISGFAFEDLEPGTLVAWQDVEQKTFRKASGLAGDVIAGVVRYDATMAQGLPGQTIATFPQYSTLSVVRKGRVWCQLDGGSAALTKGQVPRIITTGANKGAITSVATGANAAPVVVYKPSITGLVCVEINLSTGSAAVV